MKTPNRICLAAALAAVSLTVTAADRVGDWWVALPKDVYKAMSQSERTCADRAQKMLDSNSPKTAANEWKRINTEFMTVAKEESLAWASFFEAYSLDKAKDKFKAIDLYSETIELYPDSEPACAALFFRGQCQGANGMRQKELDDYRELVENPNFAKHPLAYTAHNRLAGDFVRKEKLEEAVAHWQAVKDLKPDGNRCEWNYANESFTILAQLADIDGTVASCPGKDDDKPGVRRDRMRNWRNWIWGVAERDSRAALYFKNHLGKAKDVNGARWEWLRKMSAAWLKAAKPVYEAAGSDWEYLMTEFDTIRVLSPDKLEKMILKVGGEVRKVPDAQSKSNRAKDFIGRLMNLGRANDAKLFLELIVDPVERAWKAVDIGWRTRDGNYIVEQLKPLEANPDPKVSDDAKRNHARCCQEILRDYDTAIKLYEEAPSPPGTLWSVADCHRSAGRKPKAQVTLDEICSMFPNDAPNAMLRKGDWYSQDGDKKNAIGCYRRILAHAEWKKSGAASQAHQRLEAFGIATGGAVINDVH